MILTLIMSKFDWTYFDWLIFWSQFEMKIDKTGIATESRFSYPKDLVVLQERPFLNAFHSIRKYMPLQKYFEEMM